MVSREAIISMNKAVNDWQQCSMTMSSVKLWKWDTFSIFSIVLCAPLAFDSLFYLQECNSHFPQGLMNELYICIFQDGDNALYTSHGQITWPFLKVLSAARNNLA